MRWHAQVLHVMQKDVRHSRWLLLAYAALVVGATLATSGRLGSEDFSELSLLVMLLGAFACAVLVQADSPARPDAFWASRPFRLFALPVAKLVLAALALLALALAGHAVALLANGVHSSHLPALLLDVALIYGVFLMVASCLAALTTDLRGFVVGGVLTTLAALALQWPRSHAARGTDADPSPGWRVVLLLAAGLLLFLYQYRTRQVRRGIVIALAAAVLILLPPFRSAPASARADASASPVPAQLRIPVLTASALQPDLTTGDVGVDLSADGAPPDHRYVVRSGELVVTTSAGQSTSVRRFSPAPITLSSPAPGPAALRWLRAFDVPTYQRIAFAPTPTERALLARADAQLALRLVISVETPRVIAAVPYGRSGSAAAAGFRFHLAVMEPGEHSLTLRVTGSPGDLRSLHGDLFWWGSRLQYALRNRRRGEAVALDAARGSGSQPLVLAGTAPWQSEWFLHTRTDDQGVEPLPDASWLEDAELMVTEWVPVGSYQTTLPLERDPQLVR